MARPLNEQEPRKSLLWAQEKIIAAEVNPERKTPYQS